MTGSTPGSGPVTVLYGDEAEKVWSVFWQKATIYGPQLAEVSRDGSVAVLCIEAAETPLPAGVSKLEESKCRNMVSLFEKMQDHVSANWLKSGRAGRVLVFYQGGSFLFNLDLTKDPSKRESYNLEPGSLDANSLMGQKLRLEKEHNRLNLEHKRLAEELVVLLHQAVNQEVDRLERLIGNNTVVGFDKLLQQWSQEATQRDSQLDIQTRKSLSEAMSKGLENELVRRQLDQRIVNGTGTKVADGTTPTRALAGLMASKLYGLSDARIGCPSGRWLYPEDIRKAAKEMILPPPVTPNNIEVAMMSLARFAAFIEADQDEHLRKMLEFFGVDREFFKTDMFATLLDLIGFGTHWREMGFARLELGHKLASALMFTDAPESVQAPWLAWSMILPDGIFGEVEIRRVWCLGDRPAVVLIKIGEHVGTLGLHVFNYSPTKAGGELHLDAGRSAAKTPATQKAFEALGAEYEAKFRRCLALLENLVRGVCLSMSDPAEWRKGDYYAKPSGSEIKKASKHKELPVGERYVLGQPVQIDLREEVLTQVRTGKVGGSSPTKLFLVRGHHRRQAHGPGHQLRKTIWIEPHWKGPEDARVLLRTYQT